MGAHSDRGDRGITYDALVVGTGAVSVRPPIQGLTGGPTGAGALGPGDGVHLPHSMGDTVTVMASITERWPRTAVVIGAGYVGPEMAEALTTRGIAIRQLEALPTVDADLGALIHTELERTGWRSSPPRPWPASPRAPGGDALRVDAHGPAGPVTCAADLVLVVVGVCPDCSGAAG